MLKKIFYKITHPFLWYKISKFKTIYGDKKIAFYGAGIFAQELFENFYFSDLNILGIIDRDYGKKGTKIANYEIFFFDEIETLNPDIIVSTVINHSKDKIIPPILTYLKEKNLKCKVVYDFNYEIAPENYNEKITKIDKIAKNLNPIFNVFSSLPSIIDIVMWLTGTFLANLVPKKKNSILFLGKNSRYFLDNAKYLYNHLVRTNETEIDFSFLTEDKQTFELLKEKNLPVCFYPDFKTAYRLLRTGIAITADNPSDAHIIKQHFLFGAKKIQLWHGVGFKTIEFTMPEIIENMKSIKHRINYFLKCRFPKYDILNSTSAFYTENVFKPAFLPKEIFEGGYPRKDVMFREPDKLDLIETDIENYNKIIEYKNQGYKTILYAPTFRDSRNDPISDGVINLEEWSQYGEKNKIIFILKFHPTPNTNYTEFNKLKNIIIYNNTKDIYPALRNIDLMVTDYSSIYMDYLLINKPVLFFPYDYEKYISKDRNIQFDYNWITPGSKCYNQDELFQEIENVLINNVDDYKEKREEIKNMAFKDPDGNSSKRIWDFIKKKYL